MPATSSSDPECTSPLIRTANVVVPGGSTSMLADRSTPSTDPDDALAGADAIEAAIVAEGPETVAAVFLEPVQNAGGCLVPPDGYFQRVREICDRHGVLLVSDEVICAFGRLGDWFGAGLLGYQPDMVTFAKGVTSGYAPLGGVMVSDKLAAPFREHGTSFLQEFAGA